MLKTRSNSSIRPELAAAVPTGAEADLPVTPRNVDDSQRWERIIDYRLIEWGRDPSLLDDDGVEPPGTEVIKRAIVLAQQLKWLGKPAPDSVVPDPNGGIVFEVRRGDVVETLHVWDDESVEYCLFHGTRLVERQSL